MERKREESAGERALREQQETAEREQVQLRRKVFLGFGVVCLGALFFVVFTLWAAKELGATGTAHLACHSGNVAIYDGIVTDLDYGFDDVWFVNAEGQEAHVYGAGIACTWTVL